MESVVAGNPFHPVDPAQYGEHGYPFEWWARLRREDPVHRWEGGEGQPFWAITRHADIMEISTQPQRFLSKPGLVMSHRAEPAPEATSLEGFPPNLIGMDPPQHLVARRLVSGRFTPRAMRRYHDQIESIAKGIVDDLIGESDSGECDFVEAVAAPLPIAVIAWMMGVPEQDWRLIFDWTNRFVGTQDPEYNVEGQDPQTQAREALTEIFDYFRGLIAEKRRTPGDDLVSLLTSVDVDGKRLELREILSWCFLIMGAGNETTRNATSGGMLAFVEHKDQLRRIQKDPALLGSAVEEVLRWTSPVIHFVRTATEEYELRGKQIRADDKLVVFYPSGNRDEDIFDAADRFDIGRDPNRHLAFGVGEHFCLGAHVARLELRMAYKYLLPRIEDFELIGPPQRLHSALLGGLKHLPIRYKLRKAA